MKPFPSRKSADKIRLVATQLATAIAQLAPNWKWQIDGVATATVLIVLILDRTAIKVSAAGPWINVLAIFCLGLILHRNLRPRQTGNLPLASTEKSFLRRLTRRR